MDGKLGLSKRRSRVLENKMLTRIFELENEKVVKNTG
jgi:hypothetical protein